MRLGTVTGAVWSSKKCPALSGQILLRVRTGNEEIVAADLVGAGRGERVLLATGTAARMQHRDVPIDAAIIAILDEGGDEGER